MWWGKKTEKPVVQFKREPIEWTSQDAQAFSCFMDSVIGEKLFAILEDSALLDSESLEMLGRHGLSDGDRCLIIGRRQGFLDALSKILSLSPGRSKVGMVQNGGSGDAATYLAGYGHDEEGE